MDDIGPTLNNEAGEEASLENPSVSEPKAPEEVEVPEPEATAEGTEQPAETVDAPKKGAQSRIRELNSEKNQYKEKAQSLEQKLAELTGSVEPTAPQAQFTPQVDAGQELTPEQYRSHVMGTASAMVELKIKQSEAVNRINSEANQVVRDFPQLDPESDQFDAELSESVTQATESYVRANPYTASPKKYVEKLMKPFTRAVTKEVGKETANIARQVAESATRPTSVTTRGGKSDAEKSIQELEAELGVVQA
jgi:SMC interacting uncharacterized protein involved in chromosome segregation